MTSVSAPDARACGITYSSLRVLLPPNARAELRSSRARKTLVVPDGQSLRERLCRGWIGVGPGRVSWVRGREARAEGRDGMPK